jgi:hypothetical protein
VGEAEEAVDSADGRPYLRHFRSRSVSIRAESAAGCCRRLG